ncbi:MAG: thiamine phosphate synthase [Planctomycetota bacterium]
MDRTAEHRMDERRRSALRLCLITDGRADLNGLVRLVERALEGGVRAVQLREPGLSARQLASLAERLMPDFEQVGGLLLVNDRADLAAAGVCHGVQIGHRSLPPARARAAVGPDRLVGCSVHEPADIEQCALAGCDFGVLAPVLPTPSKPGVPHLGIDRAARWTERAGLPLLWLGGFDASSIAQLAHVPARGRPLGIAVRSAICGADDPGAASWRLSQELGRIGL